MPQGDQFTRTGQIVQPSMPRHMTDGSVICPIGLGYMTDQQSGRNFQRQFTASTLGHMSDLIRAYDRLDSPYTQWMRCLYGPST